ITDGFNGTTSVITNGFSNINTLVGSSANGDTLTGANVTSSWKFDVGSLKLEVGSTILNFSSIESLVGGTASDTFFFADGVTFNGAIDGGAGNDTLTYASSTMAHSVVLTSVGSTDGFNGNADDITNGFSNINVLIGDGLDTLTGLDANATWSVTSANTINYVSGNTLNVTAFAILVGGNANDALTFAAFSAAQNFTLASLGNVDGFNLTATSFNGEFRNINTLVGGASSDMLNGLNAATAWKFEVGSSKLEVGSNTLTFSSIETLNGGTDVDTFTFADAQTFNGVIDGKGGDDQLLFTNYTTALSVVLTSLGATDGFNGTVAPISGGFKNINAVTGGAAIDSLTALNTDNLWNIVGADSGN
ncbi:MAG: hypothetical protein HY785_29085, partial [Oscillatoriophycideae cyanobacterium NC_groundwater_1537_Pr4_S-0.65um_50_18]|nr:hypothetical protein [Oscillatoriophycideae cyanobacterium NC_groundwater_1537_Pr4_S-0.65um_50_18]